MIGGEGVGPDGVQFRSVRGTTGRRKGAQQLPREPSLSRFGASLRIKDWFFG